MKCISTLGLLFLMGCTDYEALAEKYCEDKGGVKGYQVRWGFHVLHCNNRDFIFLDDL